MENRSRSTEDRLHMCTAPFSTSGARLLDPLVCTRCSFISSLRAGRWARLRVPVYERALIESVEVKEKFPDRFEGMLWHGVHGCCFDFRKRLTSCPSDTTFPTQFGCTASSYRECPVPTSRSANILPLMCTFTNHTIMTQRFHAVLRTARAKAVTFDPPARSRRCLAEHPSPEKTRLPQPCERKSEKSTS